MTNNADVLLWRDPNGTARVFGLDVRCITNSPTGIEWGYAGSGPADLALSILLDRCGDLDWALQHHQVFKGDAVVSIPKRGGMISADYIQRWIAERGGPLRGELEAGA